MRPRQRRSLQRRLRQIRTDYYVRSAEASAFCVLFLLHRVPHANIWGFWGIGCRRRRKSVLFLRSTKRSSASGKWKYAGQAVTRVRMYRTTPQVRISRPPCIEYAGGQRISQTTGLPRGGVRHNLPLVTRAERQPHLFLGAHGGFAPWSAVQRSPSRYGKGSF